MAKKPNPKPFKRPACFNPTKDESIDIKHRKKTPVVMSNELKNKLKDKHLTDRKPKRISKSK